MESSYRLDRPVDDATDHVLGPASAPITLVEYGSYACPHCRAANERIAEVRDEFGDRLRYVFRHRPVTGNELARRAAEIAELAESPEEFWKIHVELMTRSETLTEEDLRVVTAELAAERKDDKSRRQAAERVDADEASARASGVRFTPTFYINGRRYEGLWEASAFQDALIGSLGHRVQSAALDFARWAPSAGILLLLATILALVLTNSRLGPEFLALWELPVGVSAGDGGLQLPLLRWINEGVLALFFLVVGLEIKREFTVGHLSSLRAAALPIAAALGGMAGPVLLYMLILPDGPWAHGWGVPMATDTAFAVALIVMLGNRVPVELRVFLTAATIIDDIGAIVVVALFYSHGIDAGQLGIAAVILAALILLPRFGIYAVTPYLVLGALLWIAIFLSGLHATLAGVLLALVIPTRPPPNLRALMSQANAILIAEARQSGEALRHGPSASAMQALDAIHDRLESPADRLLRVVSLRSNYVVLPIFALANAGVVWSAGVIEQHGALVAAVVTGLVAGKPLGMLAATALAVWLRIAVKPDGYTWLQIGGAGALSGIGFTMSLFIAGEAFMSPADFDAAKIAVFAASLLSAIIGTAILWSAGRGRREA